MLLKAPARPAGSFSVTLGDPVPLLDQPEQWGTWHHHDQPPALDGRMALLRTRISAPHAAVLRFGELRDRASVFLDGQPVGVLLRELNDHALSLRHATGLLTILVEDLGLPGERKGVRGVTLDGRPVSGWDVMPLHVGRPVTVRPCGNVPVSGPVFRRATFVRAAPGELFLDTSAWGCGVVWVNGHDLGRYWSRTPQVPLHVPASAVREGTNELVVLEIGVPAGLTARFTSAD